MRLRQRGIELQGNTYLEKAKCAHVKPKPKTTADVSTTPFDARRKSNSARPAKA